MGRIIQWQRFTSRIPGRLAIMLGGESHPHALFLFPFCLHHSSYHQEEKDARSHPTHHHRLHNLHTTSELRILKVLRGPSPLARRRPRSASEAR
ncbi:hypothetical protein Pcinc_037693 [Petrolisthes cinctipes]|uniref:Uncharacterized protein n=1 Tax=Petrolisthes cinctipes TaxID=88211 RepID=A0AAE1BVG7_PETCI|nr:hypothetical protein Pcinc_037693 [Petrolisthes cinctipes]